MKARVLVVVLALAAVGLALSFAPDRAGRADTLRAAEASDSTGTPDPVIETSAPLDCPAEMEIRDVAQNNIGAGDSSAVDAAVRYLSAHLPGLATPDVIDQLAIVARQRPYQSNPGRTVVEYRVAGKALLRFRTVDWDGSHLLEQFAGCRLITDAAHTSD